MEGEGEKWRGAESQVPAPRCAVILCVNAAVCHCCPLYPAPTMSLMETDFDHVFHTCKASHPAPICALTLCLDAAAFRCRPLCPATRMNVMKTNLDGVFHTCKASHPLLQKSGSGRVVIMSSIAALHGYGPQAAYCASKVRGEGREGRESGGGACQVGGEGSRGPTHTLQGQA